MKFGFGNRSAKSPILASDSSLEALRRTSPVLMLNLDGTILDASDAFLATTGYGRADLLGKPQSMLEQPAFAASAEYKAMWTQLAHGETATAERECVGKGGRSL